MNSLRDAVESPLGSREWRSGEKIEDHAIVLNLIPLKETHRLVHLLTLEHGRIASVARGAARSKKRFGAALEPMNYVKAQLQVPRNEGQGDAALWSLLSVDSRASYLHLRKSFAALETSFFVLRLIQDLVPEGVADAALFKSLGRFLRDSENFDFTRFAGWARSAFFSWFAFHFGYGNLDEVLAERWSEISNSEIRQAFQQALKMSEPDFLNFFKVLSLVGPKDLCLNEEILLYQKWIDLSGIHWEHFEKWLTSKKF